MEENNDSKGFKKRSEGFICYHINKMKETLIKLKVLISTLLNL